MTMGPARLRLAAAAALAAVCGCATYDSPFVHKSEEELDEMEKLDEAASAHFARGEYDAAEMTLLSLSAEPTVSRPLYELERVSVLLQKDRRKEARELMMKVGRDFELLFDERSEKEAVSLWHGENNKVFKGDAHERSTLYAFLALSFMETGEWDDAERCVKNGLLADSANTEEAKYNSDYALLQYLGYVACAKAGRSADADAYARELRGTLGEGSPSIDILSRSPLPNAFAVVWAGTPPSYVRGGAHSHVRHVVPGTGSPFSYLTAGAGDGTELQIPSGLADVNFQATTRGGRQMDTILANKAAVKTGMAASGNVLLVAGFACFAMMGSDSRADIVFGSIGGGCILLGCTFHIVGACINSRADVRSWKNLPGELLVVPMVLPPGEQTVSVRGYLRRDNVVCVSKGVTVSPDAIATAHLSLMRYPKAPNPVDGVINAGVKASNDAQAPISASLPFEITPVPDAEAGAETKAGVETNAGGSK